MRRTRTGAFVGAMGCIAAASWVTEAGAQGVDPGRAPERGLGLPSPDPEGPERGLGVTRAPAREEPELVPRRRRRIIAPEPPPPVPYEPGLDIPAGYRLERRYDVPFLASGLALFGFTYIVGVGVAASEAELFPSRPGDRVDRNEPLYVPLMGSFVALGRSRPSEEVGLLIGHGILQLGGLSLAMVGIAKPRLWLVPEVVVGPTSAFRWRM